MPNYLRVILTSIKDCQDPNPLRNLCDQLRTLAEMAEVRAALLELDETADFTMPNASELIQ